MKPILLAALLALAACRTDPYDTGDGPLSYYAVDLVEATASQPGTVDRAVTDRGDTLRFAPPVAAAWATTTDSAYRALAAYDASGAAASSAAASGNASVQAQPTSYNTTGNSAAAHGAAIMARAFSLSRVAVLRPSANADTLGTDPLDLEAAWATRRHADGEGTGGWWLNLRLRVKTGHADSEQSPQLVGVVADTTTDAQGRAALRLTLHHRQNGAPQYYSASVFASIPIVGLTPSTNTATKHPLTITLRVPTASGWISRRVSIPAE